MNRTPAPAFLATALAFLASGCTTFATVRSAEVVPGPSVAVHASASTPPGDVAGWFWRYECATSCDGPVVGVDAGATYGVTRGGGRAFAVSIGTSGVHPYADGYVQLAGGRRPFGVGARLGPPVTGWREHQLYARYDVPVGANRLLLNPALFVHEGRSPSGENPGRFVGFVQGIGLEARGAHVSWTPAVAIVAGRAERTSYGTRYGPVNTVFATASVGVTVHQRREATVP